MTDIFDTRFEGQEVELSDNKVGKDEDINLFEKDPSLENIIIGAGWDENTFSGENIDVDISLFLLRREKKPRQDSDFIFYNQPESPEGGIKHGGDSRSGAGDGDDEAVALNFNSISFDIIHIPIVLSIYKGFEKQQTLDSIRNGYVRIVNARNNFEILRFEISDFLKERTETGAIVGWLNREGPKWHLKTEIDYFPGGLGEIARGYDIIINQE